MEIDITSFVATADPYEFSASRAELGQDAGKITWNNAKAEASLHPLISTYDEIEEFRRWIHEFGAWDDDEIAAWDSDEVNALLIQFISGDLRELEHTDDGAIDWKAVEEKGNRICQGDNGRIYFYMGS